MPKYHREPHNLDSHMNFRMQAADKLLIEAAAALLGLRPQTYARQKLLEIAKKDIAEMSLSNTLLLDNKSWDEFMAIMEAPVRVNENLKSAVSYFNQVMLDKNDDSAL